MTVVAVTVKNGIVRHLRYAGRVTHAEQGPNLQERKKRAARDHIASVGQELFVAHGFEAVTTDQIARAAGISPRSLFRYFPTKEDVLLNGVMEAGEQVEQALRARPAEESPWEALRLALRVLMEKPVYPPDDLLAISTMLVSTPSLRARELEKHEHWTDLLLPHVMKRMPEDLRESVGAELPARAVIGAALACMHAATVAWINTGGTANPLLLLDQAIEAVRG